jgi:hypothetical protein
VLNKEQGIEACGRVNHSLNVIVFCGGPHFYVSVVLDTIALLNSQEDLPYLRT